MSSLNASHDHLQTAWQALQKQWQASCDLWNDPVRWHFEREYWQGFERVVPATMDEMQKLERIVAQARRNVK